MEISRYISAYIDIAKFALVMVISLKQLTLSILDLVLSALVKARSERIM